MSRKIIRLSLIGATLAITNFANAQNSLLEWPKITQQNKSWTRWWWEGSAINNKDLSWMLQEYSKVYLGGVEITPINAGKDGLFTAAKWEPGASGLLAPVTITSMTTTSPK